MITRRSRSLASCDVEVGWPCCHRPATSVPTVSRSLRSRGHGVLGGRAVGRRASSVACTRTSPSTTFGGAPGAAAETTAAVGARPRPGFDGGHDGVGPVLGRRRSATGLPDPAGKWRASTSWPVTDSTLSRKSSDCGDAVGLEGRDEAAEHQEREQRDDPGAPGVPADDAGHPTPDTPVPDGVLGVHVVHAREPGARTIRRPTSSRTAGRKVSAATTAPAMPIAPTGPSPRVLPSSESSRHSRPRMTVAAAGGDRLDRGPPGHAHRDPLARVVVQLLAVAGDQQQRVVGGRADHEDRQDALALAVERDRAVLGQRVDDQRGRARARTPR